MIVVPKVRQYARTTEESDLLKKCREDVTALFDSTLPSNWRDYIRIFVSGEGVEITGASDYMSNLKKRTFRRVKPGEEFTLSSKHWSSINERINAAEEAKRKRGKIESVREAVRECTSAVRSKYAAEGLVISTSESGLEIRLSPAGDSYDAARVKLYRNGTFSGVEIPSPGNYATTIDRIRQHLEKWEPIASEVLRLAEQIKAELPDEFFLKTEAANG